MASDKKKRKLAKQKNPRPKPAVHPDGDRRRRGGMTADQGVRDKRARQILYLNEPIPADQALAWGLTNWVVPTVRRGEEWIEDATPDQIRQALPSA